MGLLAQLTRLDDRLGLSSSAAVERRLDYWPGARDCWEARSPTEREGVVYAALRGKEPAEREDIALWLAALETGETSALTLIIGGSVIVTVLAFALVLGADLVHSATGASFLGVVATTTFGQAYQLRQIRNRRRMYIRQHFGWDDEVDAVKG